jgi:molybdopterin-containing oxidoreductase family iron-sulfur binding subunit
VGCDDITHSKFFRSRFKELGKDELNRILADMKAENLAKFGKDTTTTATGAQPGVEFGYALDLSRCTGCRRCVHACVDENNQGREDEIHWIRVLEMEEKHGIDFHHADPYYDHETVPNEGNFYLPVACQQCRNAPCVKR